MNIEEVVRITKELVKPFEGFSSKPYICPAGVPTIGYGATYYEDGTRVKLTDPPIDEGTADRLLDMMIRTEYLPAVMRLCPNVADENRCAALVDFAYNLGENNLRISTLRKRVLADNWDDVPRQLRRWVRGGGKVLKGLVRRRNAEANLVEATL